MNLPHNFYFYKIRYSRSVRIRQQAFAMQRYFLYYPLPLPTAASILFDDFKIYRYSISIGQNNLQKYKDAIQRSLRSVAMDKYECTVCGYVYDPEKGDPDGGIAPGTKWEDIPDDWVCPLCGAGKDSFQKK